MEYQWWFNETNLLTDATNALFTLGSVQEANFGGYSVVISNPAGVKTSAVARLSLALPDRDGDGLPDDFELAHGLNPDNPDDGAIDSDRDGLTNAQEYRAGTNPTNAASVLKLELPVVTVGGDALTLQFNAVSNRSYRIEYRDHVKLGSWQEAFSLDAAPTNRTVEVTRPAIGAGVQRFYRIGAREP